MRNKLLLVGLIGSMFTAVPVADGAILAEWQFPNSGTLTTANIVDPNVTAAPLARGASTNTPVFTNDFYASKPVMSISRSNDTALAVYVEVTITANAGSELNLDSFTFDGAAGGGTSGQRIYEVHSSVAGLARDADISPAPPTSLASGGFTTIRGSAGSTGPMQPITADLSSAAYDHLSSLTMRVYFYTPTVSQNVDLDNLTFNGSVAALPEPSTLSAGLGLAFGALAHRRPRRRSLRRTR